MSPMGLLRRSRALLQDLHLSSKLVAAPFLRQSQAIAINPEKQIRTRRKQTPQNVPSTSNPKSSSGYPLKGNPVS